jgi:hypothetical protein
MTQPAMILQNGLPVVTVSPILAGVSGTGTDAREFACEREFVAPIGSRFVLAGGAMAEAGLQWVGTSEAIGGGVRHPSDRAMRQ